MKHLLCVSLTLHTRYTLTELISTMLGIVHFKAHFLKSPHYQIEILNICDVTMCQTLSCTYLVSSFLFKTLKWGK